MTGNKPYLHFPLLHTTLQQVKVTGMLVLLLSMFLPVCGYAQTDPGYDEVSVTVNLSRVGSMEVPAVIKNDKAYLSVTDLFNFLKISNHPTAGFDSVPGFFMNEKAVFLILHDPALVIYKGKTFGLDSGAIIKNESGLYLRADYFEKIFDLTCSFNFRSLSVLLTTSVELPVMREMRQSMLRSNSGLLRGELIADTIVRQRSPLFSAGMADWSVSTRQQSGGTGQTGLGLSLGATVAGGETNLSLNLNTSTRFDERQQYYRWRLVNNDNPVFKQVIAGKFYSQSIATIYMPIVGVQVTNTPTLYRRSFGSYTLSNFTEPGWIVELYVNEVLINYVKADASGFFTFQVPMVYGNTAVKLRFYGPYGEERSKEGNIVIPFNFLPVHELNYSVSAGVVEDSVYSRFSRATLNYGLGKRITVGGGVEYLSSIRSYKTIPFLNTAFRLASSLMMYGEYAYNVRTKGLLTYHNSANLQVELTYVKYKKGQLAISNNYLEERNLMISVPFRTKTIAAFARLTVNQQFFPNVNYVNGEMLLSVTAYKMSANLTTYTFYNTTIHPLVYSTLALNYRLRHQITLIPQVQYEYGSRKISMLKGQIDKQFIKNGYLTMSYEKNYYYHIDNAALGFRYDFAFAQTYTAVNRSNHISSFVQSARGSIMYDSKTGYVNAGNRSSIGRGGVVLMPYLDINCNGKRDADEPKAFGLKVRIRDGNVQYVSKDTSIRFFNLEPYTQYYIGLDSNSFDNIAWRLNKKSYSVYIDANQFQLIEIPVAVVGEVSGMVVNDKDKKGVEKITVSIYLADNTLVTRLQTESDGSFSFLGLAPGSYTARLNNDQLKRLNLVSSVTALPFVIKRNQEGDVAEGLEFHVSAQ